MDKKHKLTYINLYEEDGQYYLRLEYQIEDDSGIHKLEIPQVEIPFNSKAFPDLVQSTETGEEIGRYNLYYPKTLCTLKTGHYPMYVKKAPSEIVNHKVFYTIKTIEEKVKEVTMKDIEKKFGCKVKIVRE